MYTNTFVACEHARPRDPDGAGARRINSALSWLDEQDFIRLTRRRGRPPQIRVLLTGSASAAEGRYVRLPLEIWQEGWLLLSGRALAIYLVLKEASGGRSTGVTLAGDRKAQYTFPDETCSRAAEELSARGLLEVDEVYSYSTDSDRSEGEPKRRRLSPLSQRRRPERLMSTIHAAGWVAGGAEHAPRHSRRH